MILRGMRSRCVVPRLPNSINMVGCGTMTLSGAVHINCSKPSSYPKAIPLQPLFCSAWHHPERRSWVRTASTGHRGSPRRASTGWSPTYRSTSARWRSTMQSPRWWRPSASAAACRRSARRSTSAGCVTGSAGGGYAGCARRR